MTVAKGFDQRLVQSVPSSLRSRADVLPRPQHGKRIMSVMAALEWAFGTEHARIDFDLTGAHDFDRVGVSPEWRMMQEAKLGCRIDGGSGGGADVCADAALIAAAVEALALNPMYGRGMAVVVADCARAGTVPNWRGEPKVRVAPMGWDIDNDGQQVGYEVDVGEWEYRDHCQRKMRRGRSRACPIQYLGGAANVAAARRRYLDWWGALLEVSVTLRIPGYLGTMEISQGMPQISPWRVVTQKNV